MPDLKLYVAGGCEEHGRNCFLVRFADRAVLFDCGVLHDGDLVLDPLLDARMVRDIGWAFISHSHAGHAGAVGFLESLGFSGTYVMTGRTYSQLGSVPSRCRIIDGEGEPLVQERLDAGLTFRWGWSGHCAGSAWYQVAMDGGTVLFTGDYSERSPVYPCTPIRSLEADLAIIDCAGGVEEQHSYDEQVALLLGVVGANLQADITMVFPVPPQRRGIELMALIHDRFPDAGLFASEALVWQAASSLALADVRIRSSKEAWNYKGSGHGCCVFLSDPQFRPKVIDFSTRLVERCSVILTGTVEKDGPYADLLKTGRAVFCRYPTHQRLSDVHALAEQNRFSTVLLADAPAGAFDHVLGSGRYAVCQSGTGMVL